MYKPSEDAPAFNELEAVIGMQRIRRPPPLTKTTISLWGTWNVPKPS